MAVSVSVLMLWWWLWGDYCQGSVMAVLSVMTALVTARGCCCGGCGDDSVGSGDGDGGLGDNKSPSMLGTKKAGDL